jgi:hypothetical protein
MGSYKVGPYRYGEKKWDDYLLDVTYAVEEGTQRQAAQGEQFIEEIRRSGSKSEAAAAALSQNVNELRQDLNLGFTLMLERLDEQAQLMQGVIDELQGIHRTLKSPLLTQARELFRIGQEHLRRGLLKKALEYFLESEKKFDVDFALQLQIGKLYLYGRDREDDLIDLEAAETHLLLSAKYSTAHSQEFARWDRYFDEANLHLANVYYVRSSTARMAGNATESEQLLHKALHYCSVGTRYRARSCFCAKCEALLGKSNEAVTSLAWLIDRWRGYFPMAANDQDFRSIRSEIQGLPEKLLREPGTHSSTAARNLAEAQNAVSKAERAVARAGPNDNPRSQALVKVTLDTLKRSLEYQTSALRSESAILTRIEKDCAKLADEAKALIVSVLTEREVELIKQRNNSQSTIQANTAELKELRNRSMNFPHFTGVGCLVAIGSFIVCVGVLGRSGIMPLGGIVVVCFGIWLGICFAIGIIRHELPISAQRSKKASVEVEMNRKIDTIETELATLQSLKLDLVGK